MVVAGKEEVGCLFNILTASTHWAYAVLKVVPEFVGITFPRPTVPGPGPRPSARPHLRFYGPRPKLLFHGPHKSKLLFHGPELSK